MHLFRLGYGNRRRTCCVKYAAVLNLLLSIWCCNVASASQNIIVISSSSLPAYQQAGKALGRQLQKNGLSSIYPTQFLLLDEITAKAAASVNTGDTVVVTIGSAAADYAVRHFVDALIICSFITRNAFAAISADLPATHTVTAVFIDQPIKRLIKLSMLLRKDQSPYQIGLLSQRALPVQNIVNELSEPDYILEVNAKTLSLDENPIRQIEPIMKSSDVFIIRPDTSLFNRLVAKLVLQLSMRYKTPVIGFSQKYAKAGALLSLYASPENIGQDTGNLLNEWLRVPLRLMPVPRDGEQFSLVVNQRIARKLGIEINPEELTAILQNTGGK